MLLLCRMGLVFVLKWVKSVITFALYKFYLSVGRVGGAFAFDTTYLRF